MLICSKVRPCGDVKWAGADGWIWLTTGIDLQRGGAVTDRVTLCSFFYCILVTLSKVENRSNVEGKFLPLFLMSILRGF